VTSQLIKNGWPVHAGKNKGKRKKEKGKKGGGKVWRQAQEIKDGKLKN
jgi:hypothetical protein